MTEKLKNKINIDDVLDKVNYKRTKEFMRTDKPSRRKLYIEIYEFKDKELLKKLPVKKADKTDEAKEAVIEFNAGTREIIQMKLKSLNRNAIELLRFREYAVKYHIERIEEIERLVDRNSMRVYGEALPPQLNEAHQRYYLITERNGKVIGLIGMEGRTLLDSKNKVIHYGGDIMTLAILEGKAREVNDIVGKLYEQEAFKKIPIFRLSDEVGNGTLLIESEEIRQRWLRFGRGSVQGYGFMHRDMREGMRAHGRDYLDYYYSDPPIKEITTGTELELWKSTFRTNFEATYGISNPLKFDEGMTKEQRNELIAAWETERKRQCNMKIEEELNKKMANYDSNLRHWIETIGEVLRQYSDELYRMSAVETLTNHGHEEHNRDEDNCGDDDDEMAEVSCTGCDEFASHYCRNECGRNPCDECNNDTPCDECDYQRNGGN